MCGKVRDLRPTGGVEQLGARLSGIVFGGDRLLVTFPEVADARDALAQTVAALDRCPASSDAPAGDEVLVGEAEPVGLGEEAVRVTMGSQVDGEWALNSTIYHVVRQGNALLLAYDGGEGGGSDAAIAIEQRTSARALGGVVEAMCVYRDGRLLRRAGRRTPSALGGDRHRYFPAHFGTSRGLQPTGSAKFTGSPVKPTSPRQRFCRISRISWAVAEGVLPTLTPTASRASCLAAAVPAEPETMAPAWPMVLPSGAVKPAT